MEFASGSLRLHGFVFRPSGSGRHPAVLFLHGIGQDDRPEISAVGGVYAGREQEAYGIPARMRLQDELLSTEQMDDVLAPLAYLRAMPAVAIPSWRWEWR